MTRVFAFWVLLCTFVITSTPKADAETTESINTAQLFNRAWNSHFMPVALSMADTLYKEAVRLGNAQLQCSALSVKMAYYFSNGRTTDLENTIEQLQTLSRKDSDLYPYYYFAGLYSVNNYIYHRGAMKAMIVIQKMEEMSKKDKLRFAAHCVDLSNSVIYAYNGQHTKAMEKTNQALQNAEDWADSMRVYTYKAGMLMEVEKYDEVVKYTDMAYKLARYDTQRFNILHAKCLALYYSGKYAEYRKCFDLLVNTSNKIGNQSSNAMTQARIYLNLVNGEHDMAQKLANTLDNSYLYDKIEIMKSRGRYGDAFELFMKNIRYTDSLSLIDNNNDIKEFDDQFGNAEMRLKLKSAQEQNDQIKLENIRLGLENSQLELRQSNTRTDLLKETTRYNNLQLEKQYAQMEKIRANQQMEENKKQDLETKYKHRRRILAIIIFALILAMILLALYLYYKRTLERRIDKQNKKLVKAYQLVEESIEKKKAFLKMISHEIRTPINAIVGFTDIMTIPGLELGEEELSDMKDRIRVNKLHLKTLMNDILDTKALETGNLEMNIQETKVNEACRSVLPIIREQCATKGIALSFNSNVDDKYTIITDEQRLQQVLINYLTNAEKNTASGEIRLQVNADTTDDLITFSVEDTGTGVPEDKADTIFERFEKVDQFVQGTGMGLYMCRLIARRLGGKAELDKSYKNGARFLFKLKKALTLLLFAFSMLTASAQPASQKDLQRLYDEARLALHNPKCPQLADDVFNMAGRMKDVDMQCRALYVKVAYYGNKQDYEGVLTSCDELKDFAEKHHVGYYFYLAWYTKINRLFLMSRPNEAMIQLNAMRKQAFKENDIYGLSRYHRALANIYARNGKYSLAINKYYDELKEIENVSNENIKGVDIGDVYGRIGACQKYLGQYDAAAATFDKAIKLSRQAKTRNENKIWRGIVAFMQNDRGLFLKYYNEVSHNNMAMQTMSSNLIRQFQMLYYISQNQWKKAFELCNQADPKAMDYMLMDDYYYFRGDTMRALEMKEKRFAVEQQRYETDVQRRDLARYLSQMSKELMDITGEQLESEQRLLAMNNEKLNLDKLSLEIESAKNIEQRQKAIAENSRLELEAQTDMIDKMRIESEVKRKEQEQQTIQNKRELIVMITIGVILIFLLIFVFYIIYHRQKRMNILKEQNIKLQEALEKAQETERLKDDFITQMDKDVREPLLNLTKYTKLIIEDAYENDDAGKLEAKDIIGNNANHILEIVTEAVEKAAME